MTTIVPHPVVVTGAGGFIGANLVRRLLTDGYRVHVIWKKTTNPWRLANILPKLSLHEVELSNRKRLASLMARIKPIAIFHLAAHGAYSSQTDVDEMVKINVEGLLNLLIASKDVNYQAFINTGSSSEYGFKDKPMKETDLLEPASFYAATKASATYLCQVFAKEYNKPIVTIRPFSVYGPYEEPGRFIPTIMNALLTNQPIKLTPGDERRDFVYIDDIVEAYMQLMDHANKFPTHVFNIGTGKEYTNDEVVRALFATTGRTTAIEKGAFPARSWDTSHWIADISKSKKFLAWKAKFSLEQGLKRTLQWFAANQHLYAK